MEDRSVVTCFLRHNGEVLALRRSAKVGTYQGKWAAVSGHLEAGVTPLEQAYTELAEEVGLGTRDLTLVRDGGELLVNDEQLGVRWRVHLFLFDVRDRDAVRLDWEHTESRWLPPEKLYELETVPGLAAALASLRPRE